MKYLFSLLSIFIVQVVMTQPTVGLINYEPENLEGYVLFSPMRSTDTWLIDKCGEIVHQWSTSNFRPGLSTYLLGDGSLLRTGQTNNPNFNAGGSGGMIEQFDWEGNLTWSYQLSDSDQCQHHDIAPLPNGNILVIVWDRYSRAEAIANGKDSTYSQPDLWSEKIIELQPVGTEDAIIVWEWKLWDHLIQSYDATKPGYGTIEDHPERVNLNYTAGNQNSADWIHFNSIDYNPDLDQILVSSHSFSEIWILDHSTTTEEAVSNSGGNSGHGGDLLYRWGNPQAYQRGTPATKVFYGQHHATWIPPGFPKAGKILAFNNGLNRPGTYSSIDIIDPPKNPDNTYPIDNTSPYLPTDLFWTYTADPTEDFYSNNISGVYPLQNGSFMITSGPQGTFFEIDSSKQTVWTYINPVNNMGMTSQGNTPTNNLVFRCNFYPVDYSGFNGKLLEPMGEIELNPIVPSICDLVPISTEEGNPGDIITLYPNPVSSDLHIDYHTSTDKPSDIRIADLLGRTIMTTTLLSSGKIILDVSTLQNGMYLVMIDHEETSTCHQIIVHHGW